MSSLSENVKSELRGLNKNQKIDFLKSQLMGINKRNKIKFVEELYNSGIINAEIINEIYNKYLANANLNSLNANTNASTNTNASASARAPSRNYSTNTNASASARAPSRNASARALSRNASARAPSANSSARAASANIFNYDHFNTLSENQKHIIISNFNSLPVNQKTTIISYLESEGRNNIVRELLPNVPKRKDINRYFSDIKRSNKTERNNNNRSKTPITDWTPQKSSSQTTGPNYLGQLRTRPRHNNQGNKKSSSQTTGPNYLGQLRPLKPRPNNQRNKK